jgi:hypothetical protein
MDLPQYMEQSIRDSDYVLLICTPIFAEKANRGIGGVGYEKNVVTGELFTRRSNDTKFVPILRIGPPELSLPSYLQSKIFIDFRDDAQFEAALERLLRHLHGVPLTMRPPVGLKPSFQSRSLTDPRKPSNSEPVNQVQAAVSGHSDSRFNLQRFEQLRSFAYRSDGLDMTKAAAIQWAQERLQDSPPFDLERFIQLKDYAYRPDGLDMTRAAAIQWAQERLHDSPPFDLERFIQLKDYAYRPDGLDMTKAAAIEWALTQMKPGGRRA